MSQAIIITDDNGIPLSFTSKYTEKDHIKFSRSADLLYALQWGEESVMNDVAVELLKFEDVFGDDHEAHKEFRKGIRHAMSLKNKI